MYLVTRHSFPISSNVNPFGSLSEKFWISYFLVYFSFCFVVTYFSGLRKQLDYFVEILQIWISPSNTKWFHIVKAGILFQFVWTFTTWSFDFLYGIDLWSVLVNQRFEKEVNGWEDLVWHKTQFFHLTFMHFGQPTYLTLQLLLRTYSHDMSSRFVFNSFSLANPQLDEMLQFMPYIKQVQEKSETPSSMVIHMRR